jgi:hypothetical protein
MCTKAACVDHSQVKEHFQQIHEGADHSKCYGCIWCHAQTLFIINLDQVLLRATNPARWKLIQCDAFSTLKAGQDL